MFGRFSVMTAFAIYGFAALAEIAGCFAFWAWLRLDKSPWWLAPCVLALVLFAWLLTRIETDFAGRAFAAYGGIYILTSLGWMAFMEGHRPDRWDMAGGLLCIAGAALIVLGPRTA